MSKATKIPARILNLLPSNVLSENVCQALVKGMANDDWVVGIGRILRSKFSPEVVKKAARVALRGIRSRKAIRDGCAQAKVGIYIMDCMVADFREKPRDFDLCPQGVAWLNVVEERDNIQSIKFVVESLCRFAVRGFPPKLQKQLLDYKTYLAAEVEKNDRRMTRVSTLKLVVRDLRLDFYEHVLDWAIEDASGRGYWKILSDDNQPKDNKY